MGDIHYDENVIDIEKYLREVDFIIRKKGREILRDFNITGPQFIALQWLIDEGDLTIGDLSKKMSLACSTITDLIDRMEKNQLVTRVKDENDKRIVRVKVKEKSYKLVDEVLLKRRKYLDDKLKDFKEQDKLFLKQNLEKLYIVMSKQTENEEN